MMCSRTALGLVLVAFATIASAQPQLPPGLDQDSEFGQPHSLICAGGCRNPAHCSSARLVSCRSAPRRFFLWPDVDAPHLLALPVCCRAGPPGPPGRHLQLWQVQGRGLALSGQPLQPQALGPCHLRCRACGHPVSLGCLNCIKQHLCHVCLPTSWAAGWDVLNGPPCPGCAPWPGSRSPVLRHGWALAGRVEGSD
jgi:hypothetical protein